jgi:branched-chain amino acid aminotransferase
LIDERDRGFLLGDGVFETLLVANGTALWREQHLARMKKTARKLDIPFPGEVIEAAIDQKLKEVDAKCHVMRVTLTRGVTSRGLAADGDEPTLLVALQPFDATHIGKGVSLATSSTRRNPASVTDRHKTTSYANNIFAAREAKSRGADDALMLNQDGLVACTSIANIFIMRDGRLFTPPEQDGVLPGIVRRYLIEHASAEVQSIERDAIDEAEGVFVTNSLRLISPVTRIDGVDMPQADTNVLLQALSTAAEAQCGLSLLEKQP